MTYQQFENAWLGKRVDFDGVNGYQCVDLVKLYVKECYGITPGAWGSAINWWNNKPAILYGSFDPKAITYVMAGDIVMLHPVDEQPRHRDGHIGIATGNMTSNMAEILEQNGSGGGTGTGKDAIRKRYIDKFRIAGVWRPKTLVPLTPVSNNAKEIMNHNAGNELYRTALFREPDNGNVGSQWNGQAVEQALQSVRNQAEWKNINHALRVELPALRKNVSDLQNALSVERSKPPQIVEKIVEKPVEVIKEVPIHITTTPSNTTTGTTYSIPLPPAPAKPKGDGWFTSALKFGWLFFKPKSK